MRYNINMLISISALDRHCKEFRQRSHTKKAEPCLDPAFLQIKCLGLSLFLKLSPGSRLTDQTKTQKKQGGWFGDCCGGEIVDTKITVAHKLELINILEVYPRPGHLIW